MSGPEEKAKGKDKSPEEGRYTSPVILCKAFVLDC